VDTVETSCICHSTDRLCSQRRIIARLKDKYPKIAFA
jgi:hypothetical protein